MLFKTKYGLYASVYGINPPHYRQETKESIFIVGTSLSSQRARIGIRSTVLKKQLKKLTVLKKNNNNNNERVVLVRKTMVYRVNQAKTVAFNTLT